MPPLAGLTRRAEFLAAAAAVRAGAPSLTVQARAREPGEGDPEQARVGVTCSRKIGNAVARNRAKRRLRAVARAVLPDSGRAGWDYVLVGRPVAVLERPYPLLLDDLRDAIARVHRAATAGAPAKRRTPIRPHDPTTPSETAERGTGLAREPAGHAPAGAPRRDTR